MRLGMRMRPERGICNGYVKDWSVYVSVARPEKCLEGAILSGRLEALGHDGPGDREFAIIHIAELLK